MSIRTLVFEPEERDKVMVEIWDDGSVTIAFKVMDRWGVKWDPTIDDDGDRIKAPEPRIYPEPDISDDAYAAYLDRESQ